MPGDRPQLTKDLAQARVDLSRYGYCLVADALPCGDVETARDRLVAQAEAEERLGLSFRDGGPDQRIGSSEPIR